MLKNNVGYDDQLRVQAQKLVLQAHAWITVGFLLGLLGCKPPPKFAAYTSIYHDFSCEIPSGWTIIQDSSGSDYTNTTFTGPMTPEFYHGVPSFSVRWYAIKAPHRLPDGTYETYSSHEDFLRQMMRQVYRPDGYMKAGSDADQAKALAEGKDIPDSTRIKVSRWEALYTVIYHNQPAPAAPIFGVVSNNKREKMIRERHAYVLLPMNGGFYVFVYPATKDGFDKYRTAFFHLINTFKAVKDGPAGPIIHYTSQT